MEKLFEKLNFTIPDYKAELDPTKKDTGEWVEKLPKLILPKKKRKSVDVDEDESKPKIKGRGRPKKERVKEEDELDEVDGENDKNEDELNGGDLETDLKVEKVAPSAVEIKEEDVECEGSDAEKGEADENTEDEVRDT